MVDQALDDGRRGEGRERPQRAAEGEQLGRIDAARGRHDVARAGHQVRDRVDAAAVRHRRRVDHGIVGGDRVDVDEVGRAPSSSGCGASASRPWAGRWCRWCRTARPGRRARARPGSRPASPSGASSASASTDSASTCRSRPASGCGRDVARHEGPAGLGVVDDPFGLGRMQLGVDRHHHQAGPPGAPQDLEVARMVAHEEQRRGRRASAPRRAAAAPGRRCVPPIARASPTHGCLRRSPAGRARHGPGVAAGGRGSWAAAGKQVATIALDRDLSHTMDIRVLTPHSCPSEEEATLAGADLPDDDRAAPGRAVRGARSLPVGERGSRSMVKISAGHLKRPRSRSQAARTAATRAAASPAAPRSATTKATGRSPKRASGDADDGAIPDARRRADHALDLLRIHVDAAGDDHVVLTVGEVELAVGVDVADVAEGLPALRQGARARSSRAPCSRRTARRPRSTPGRSRRRGSSRPSASTMCSTPLRARPTEPGRALGLERVDQRQADAFAARVVLERGSAPTSRSSPASAPAGRARRRGSRRGASARAKAARRARGQLEQALEHRRHPLAVRDRARSSSRRSAASASKRSITCDRAAAGGDGEREAQRRRVIERRRRQVAPVAAGEVEQRDAGRRRTPACRGSRPAAAAGSRPWARRWCPRCRPSARPAARRRPAAATPRRAAARSDHEPSIAPP